MELNEVTCNSNNHVKITPPTDETKKPREKNYDWWLSNKLLIFTLLGVSFGVVVGFTLRTFKLHPDAVLIISYPGELFMRMLKLVILPLIISSLIAGTSSLPTQTNGKIAARTFTFFLVTSSFNVAFGIFLALTIRPGEVQDLRGHHMSGSLKNISLLDSMLDLGRNLVPENLFQATFQQSFTALEQDDANNLVRIQQYRSGVNTLGLVLFCIVFGITTANSGSRGRVVAEFFSAIFDVMMRLIMNTVIVMTPFGVASIIAGKILSVADLTGVLIMLAWFVFTVLLGVLFYQLVILQLIYWVMLRKNPYKFYFQLLNPMLTAFACASTAASLPVAFEVMETKLKVDSRITKFILPIGANINTDGTALFISIASIFIAQINSVHLDFGDIVTVFFLAIAASFSVSSVPSAALIMILMVLSAIKVPADDVTLLFVIDWLLDRFRTTNNMLSDCYVAAVVGHLSAKELRAMDSVNGIVEKEDAKC